MALGRCGLATFWAWLAHTGLDESGSDQARAASAAGMQRYPFGVGEPGDIANIALFLASDESRMINGAVIPAEGGMSVY